MRNNRRGFTVVELVLVGFLASLMAAALVGMRGGMNETSNRVKCASNLRQIGQACLLYANENKMFYPRTRYDAETKKWPAYTKAAAEDPFADDGPDVNDTTAALFLLIRTQDITSEVFICPSSDAIRLDFEDFKTTATKMSNFPARANLSYSYTNPYWGEGENPLTYNLPAEFAVAGDMNPGGKDLFKIEGVAGNGNPMPFNSKNHKGEGGNFLYADGHVEWNTTPLCGANRDNVYAPGEEGETVIAAPVNTSDSVLLPTAEQDAEAAK